MTLGTSHVGQSKARMSWLSDAASVTLALIFGKIGSPPPRSPHSSPLRAVTSRRRATFGKVLSPIPSMKQWGKEEAARPEHAAARWANREAGEALQPVYP